VVAPHFMLLVSIVGFFGFIFHLFWRKTSILNIDVVICFVFLCNWLLSSVDYGNGFLN
jgi:hypothetical protein